MNISVVSETAPAMPAPSFSEPWRVVTTRPSAAQMDFNGSIVKNDSRGGYLCFFRREQLPITQWGQGAIYWVRLGKGFETIGEPVLLLENAEDPRVLWVKDRLWLTYNVVEQSGAFRVNRMSIAELTCAANHVRVERTFSLPILAGQLGARGLNPPTEKNWVPFCHASDKIGFIYSDNPRTILFFEPEAGDSHQFKLTGNNIGQEVRWPFGPVRGGTPAVPWGCDEYISLFHSSQVIGDRLIYFVGAYTFAGSDFRVTRMTRRPLLMPPYWQKSAAWHEDMLVKSIIYPCGLVVEPEGLYVSCGQADARIVVYRWSNEEIEAALTPVPPSHPAVVDGEGNKVSTSAGALLHVRDHGGMVAERNIINFCRAYVGKGRTFCDVGAHLGFYSIALHDCFDEVIAFEPSRRQFFDLQLNVVLNGLTNVAVHDAALGRHESKMELNVLSACGGSNSLDASLAARHPRILEKYGVRVLALDSLALQALDFLKIDVEGFELEVLEGARRTIERNRPVILIEVWNEEERRRGIKRILHDEYGYNVEYVFVTAPELALCIPPHRITEFSKKLVGFW